MKRFLLILAVVLALVASYHAGITHAITDSIIWTEGDTICIDLDGNIYEHTDEHRWED